MAQNLGRPAASAILDLNAATASSKARAPCRLASQRRDGNPKPDSTVILSTRCLVPAFGGVNLG